MKLNLLAIAVLAAAASLANAQTGGNGGSNSTSTTPSSSVRDFGKSCAAHGNDAMDQCKNLTEAKARDDCMKSSTPSAALSGTTGGSSSRALGADTSQTASKSSCYC